MTQPIYSLGPPRGAGDRETRAGTARPRASGPEAGFSLIEALMGGSILALMVGLAFITLLSGNRIFRDGVTTTSADDAVARVLGSIVEDLRLGVVDTLNLEPGEKATLLSFRIGEGWDAETGTVKLGPEITYAWHLATAPPYDRPESANGRDDNGNGLVDEGYVTRQQAGGDEQIIAMDILNTYAPDEDGNWSLLGSLTESALGLLGLTEPAGFGFERGVDPRDDEIHITVTTARRRDDGSYYVLQIVETVLLRN